MRLAAGQAIQIINTHGKQVVDTWCFNADDLTEFMSMEHLHASLQGIFPAKGDGLTTNRRRPILLLEEDTSPGRHDTVIAACDVHRYAALGCRDYHDNCTDNLLTMGIDDLDRLAFGQTDGPAPSCRYNLKVCRHIPVPLPLARWCICLVQNSFIGRSGRVKRYESVALGQTPFSDNQWRVPRIPVAISHRRTATSQ